MIFQPLATLSESLRSLAIAGVNWTIVTAFIVFVFAGCEARQQPKQIVIVGPLTSFAWPMYIAKEGGYYEKYGLNVKLVVANHPVDIAMLISGEAQVDLNTLQNAMNVASRDSSFVIFGSPLKKWLFALVGAKGLYTVRDLRGKRIGITQIGGNTYDFSIMLLSEFGMLPDQVQWVAMGNSSRAAALVSGSIEATMLTAPAYFELEEMGYRSLANVSDYDDIETANVLLLRRTTIDSNPMLPELLIKAHAESVKRFYDDKSFAVQAYRVYDKQDVKGLEKVYDNYASKNALNRIPFLTVREVQYVINHEPDSYLAARMKVADYHKTIDNRVLDRLIQEGFFTQLFGVDASIELDRNLKDPF